MMYSGRLPKLSAASPTIDGASPETIKYEVTVRLILSMVVCNSLARVGMAGKNMKLLRVENHPANAARKMIQRFWALVNIEY